MLKQHGKTDGYRLFLKNSEFFREIMNKFSENPCNFRKNVLLFCHKLNMPFDACRKRLKKPLKK